MHQLQTILAKITASNSQYCFIVCSFGQQTSNCIYVVIHNGVNQIQQFKFQIYARKYIKKNGLFTHSLQQQEQRSIQTPSVTRKKQIKCR